MKKLIFIILLCISCTPEQISGLQSCAPRTHVWEDAVVPFKFNDNVPQYHRQLVYETISIYEENTPLTFVEYRTNDFFSLEHGVLIKYTGEKSVNSSFYPYGQDSYISDMRLGGEQFVSLSTVIHEFGHVAGLPHEFQRADRDEYINLYFENIPDEWEGNFTIEEIDFVSPYASNSVMNYDPYAIAIDKSKPAIEMKDGTPITRSSTLTQLDIDKINELYCYELLDN
jgi:hypothetical protein